MPTLNRVVRRLDEGIDRLLRKLTEARKFSLLFMTGVLTLYLMLAVGTALTMRPWSDEGWFANPAYNLITNGSMGTNIIEPTGSNVTGRRPGVVLTGINQHTYWIMPLHILAQAGWYKIVGFSLFKMRLLSILWGLVALLSLFVIVKLLSGNQKIALLALLFIALDYAFIFSGATGRMDMMNAALGFAAFAVYLRLRERHLTYAILGSQTLVVMSGLTHPNGMLPFIGLLFLTLYFDRKQISWRHVLVAFIPYAVGALGWGIYILQSPGDFLAQFGANAANRWSGLTSLLRGFEHEITDRYLDNFYLPSYATGVSRLKVLIPVIYWAIFISAVFTRRIRQHEGYRALLILTGLYFVIMSVLEGSKLQFYLVHITPLLASILAIWIYSYREQRFVPVSLIILVVSGFLLLQIGWAIYGIRENRYQNRYMAVVNYLKQHSNSTSVTYGNPSLAFELGFTGSLIDDVTLGYRTGKRPDFIVLDEQYYEPFYSSNREGQPALYEHVMKLLSQEYRLVYDHDYWKIYARR